MEYEETPDWSDGSGEVLSCIDFGNPDEEVDQIEALLAVEDGIEVRELESESDYDLEIACTGDAADVFLVGIMLDTARRIRDIVIRDGEKCPKGFGDASLDEYANYIEKNPRSDHMKKIGNVCRFLFENRRYEELLDFATLPDGNDGRKPKWPNFYPAVAPLLILVKRSGDHERIIGLLMDENGNPRFLNNREALRDLTFALNMAERPEEVIRIVAGCRLDGVEMEGRAFMN